MAQFFTRYLIPYLMHVALAAMQLSAAIWFFDGILVYVSIAIFIIVAIASIPIMLYLDYLKILEFCRSAMTANKSGYIDLAKHLSTYTNIPKFFVNKIVEIAKTKFSK